MNVELSIVPNASKARAPPTWAVTLFLVKLEPLINRFFPIPLTAPPSTFAVFLLNTEFIIDPWSPAQLIAPPLTSAELSSNRQFSTIA